MFRRSQNPWLTKAQLDALLAALSARPAAALWDAPKVHLGVNDFVPDAATALGDFVEASFAGYTPGGYALPAFSAPVNLPDEGQAILSTVNIIAAGGIVAPGEVAYTYYITDAAGAVLYQYERFSDVVPFANPGDFLDLTVLAGEPAQRSTAAE